MKEQVKSVSGISIFEIIYASGKTGNHVRADGLGGTMKRGYYYRLEAPVRQKASTGPYKTKAAAKEAARGARSLIAPEVMEP